MSASQTATPVTPTFPTFLDTDPYPSPHDGRPMSAGSTATNATSDLGASDDFRSARERNSNIPSVTGPVGEVGLPPSRPTSVSTDAAFSQAAGGRRTSLQPLNSRRGFSSRPSTGTSKTQVPPVATPAFFRPLSSQQLQAQRSQIPGTSDGQTSATAAATTQSAVEDEEEKKRRHRYSNASLNTLRDTQYQQRDEDVPPVPTSRGTQVTSEGVLTMGSVTSATPLQHHLYSSEKDDLEAGTSTNGQTVEKPQTAPRSLRASFGLASRTSRQQDRESRPFPSTHEKLDSALSSPNNHPTKPAPATSNPTKQKSAGKNYEYFAGNMLFCFGGRCLNTKAAPLNLATLILNAAPAALFFAFSAPWLWQHISPALPIVFAYIFYLTMSSFLHAAVSDPGILPRNIHPHPPNPDEERDLLTIGPPTTEWVMVKTFLGANSNSRAPHPNRPNSTPEEEAVATSSSSPAPTTAMEVPTKYCKTCSIWRPPRAHHCRVCDICVENQDHHCVWLNNCVGRRNYRLFFAYVSLASLLALMLLAFSLVHVIYYAQFNGISFGASITGRTQERIAFAMFIYAVLALPYPGSLTVYHLFLISRGETTREFLNSNKFPKKDRHRPFTQASGWGNLRAVLLRPRGPSYLGFKRRYEEGDVRLGYVKRKGERRKEMKGRYAVQGNGNGNGRQNGKGKGALEMKELGKSGGGGGGNAVGVDAGDEERGRKKSAGYPRGAGGLAVGSGGLVGPVNSTPRS